MKDQTSPASVEIMSKWVQEEAANLSKKLNDKTTADASTCPESDEDNDFLNASNVSLKMCNDQHVSEPCRVKVSPQLEMLDDEQALNVIESTMRQLETIPEKEKRPWMMARMTEAFCDKLTEPLLEIMTGYMFDGDSGLSVDTRPDWLDVGKFRQGQKFALDYIFNTSYALLVSLFTVFSFDEGLQPIIATGASSTPYTSFKRYLSTITRVRNWYKSDPWTPGTEAYKDIKTVRRMHALVRRRTEVMTDEEFAERTTIRSPWCPTLEATRRDFESTCAAPAPGQCPYKILNRFPSLKGKKLNQGEMVATQFAFVGLIILNPKFFGIHYASDDDLEAFCHVWRGIGYLLGIEDDFNFCRGSLADVQARSRDFLDYWVKPNFREVKPEWEHMMRCVMEGTEYYFTGNTYEVCLLDVAEMMNLQMPSLRSTLSYITCIRHSIVRFYFYYGCRIPILCSLMNYRLRLALDRANIFDEQKHKELQERSARTLDTYAMERLKNEAQIVTDSSKLNNTSANIVKWSVIVYSLSFYLILTCAILTPDLAEMFFGFKQ